MHDFRVRNEKVWFGTVPCLFFLPRTTLYVDDRLASGPGRDRLADTSPFLLVYLYIKDSNSLLIIYISQAYIIYRETEVHQRTTNSQPIMIRHSYAQWESSNGGRCIRYRRVLKKNEAVEQSEYPMARMEITNALDSREKTATKRTRRRYSASCNGYYGQWQKPQRRPAGECV